MPYRLIKRFDSGSTELERFQLFTECKPINYSIVKLDSSALAPGLTYERISQVVEERLQEAGLYDQDRFRSYLYVSVIMSDSAFGLSLEYNKRLKDFFSERMGFATTYKISGVGILDGTTESVLEVLYEHVVEFVEDYYRVNEEYC